MTFWVIGSAAQTPRPSDLKQA